MRKIFLIVLLLFIPVFFFWLDILISEMNMDEYAKLAISNGILIFLYLFMCFAMDKRKKIPIAIGLAIVLSINILLLQTLIDYVAREVQ